MVIALSWHPGETSVLSAGGYKRFYEIAKRCPQPLLIIDRSPSLYNDLDNPHVIVEEYDPGSHHPLLDRLLSLFKILILILRHKKTVSTIYIPYSEHTHLTLAGVLTKLALQSKLVLCNLNVNTIFPENLVNPFLHSVASKVITLSTSLQKELKFSGIDAKFINGVGFEMPRTEIQEKKYDAIFIGRHIPQKGIFDLFKIWNILINEMGKKYRLVTIGDIPKFMTPQLKSNQHLTILGQLSETEKNKYLSQSKIMVFPSYQEGWGIAPMEALASGLPVIAYNLPVYRESIGVSVAFRTVSPGKVTDFARKIVSTLDHLDHYSILAKKWRPILSWDTVARKEWSVICDF